MKEKLKFEQICTTFAKIENQLIDVFNKGVVSHIFFGVLDNFGMCNMHAPTEASVEKKWTIMFVILLFFLYRKKCSLW